MTRANVSPVMHALSTYVARAVRRSLPKTVTDRAKLHLVDTFGAMISGTHLVPGTNKVSKPGNRQDSATTCTVWGQAYDQEGKLTSFTAVVVGKLTGKPTTSTG